MSVLWAALVLLQAALVAPSQWQWTCRSGLCVRSATVDGQVSTSASPSLELCRVLCGQYGALWPRPTGDCQLAGPLVPFNLSRVRFHLTSVSGGERAPREFVAAASRRWLHAVSAGVANSTGLADLEVTVLTTSTDLKLSWDTDESYSLTVATKDSRVSVSVVAATVFGARHGLATLRQLVACCSAEGSLVIVSSARVTDAPAYPHRGLLLDTGRNYLRPADIRRTIEAMAASKLNVLHWHATDSQSFPLLFNRVPELARWGAASPRETYSAAEVASLLEFGLRRGVRLLLELDAPAHAGQGWQYGEAAGLGALAVCVGRQPWRSYCIQPPCGQLNPANPNMYAVLAELYRDVVELWPEGQPLHMGGDEVAFSCWNASEEVTEYMAARGFERTEEGFLRLWADFQATALRLLDQARGCSDVPAILWTSHLTQPSHIERYLNKSRYVIETWVESGDPLPMNLLALGYRLVVATKDAWYLDHGFWGSTRYHDWKTVYNNRLPGTLQQGVLGGEAASWGELVDSQGLDARVWPRAAALAERLWSDPPTSSSSRHAEARFSAHRERLVAGGVRAEAIAPRYCVLNEGACQ